MFKAIKKMLEKDLAVASNIGKWLIIIALSGIALYLLFLVIVAILVAVFVVPKMRTLIERLRGHPDMKHPSMKKKCMTVLKESIIVMFPDQLKDIKFMKDAHQQILKTCDQASSASSVADFYNQVVKNAHAVDEHASPAYDSHHASTHAAAEAAKHNLTPHSVPVGAGAMHTAGSANADGLGIHSL